MSPPTLLQSKPHESGAFFLLLLPAVAGYSACASHGTRFARMGFASLAWDSLRSHGIRFAGGILGLRSRDTRCARKIEDHVNQVDFLGGE